MPVVFGGGNSDVTDKGNPSVSIGAYFNVLRVLNLHEDFLKLAADDELGRKLQDLKLLRKPSE